jgi:pilus assembly protein CpaE
MNMNKVTKVHDPDVAHGGRDPQFAGRSAGDCLAIVGDNQTHGVVSAVCEQRFPLLRLRDGSSREALEILAGSSPPAVLILDISDAPKPLTAIMPIMATFGDNTKVIAIGTVNDINLYREMIETGVVEYLIKPVTEKSLLGAIARLDAKPEEPKTAAPPSKRTLVAVLGTRGGVGSTTIALNLAWLSASEQMRRTSLLDLDLQNGTIALSLDIEPTRGLREALENPARIDSLFISSAAIKLGERLSVLAAEEAAAEDVHYDPSAVDLLLEEMHRQSETIVVDLPRGVAAVRARTLAAASHILVVTDLTLAGLRDAIRVVGVAQQVAPQARLMVIASRTGERDGVTRGEFEKALNRKIDFIIPEDAKAVTAAANTGKPLAAGAGGKILPVLRQIVAEFSVRKETKDGSENEEKKGFFWRRPK